MSLITTEVRLSVPRKLSDISLEQVQSVLLLDQNPDISEFARKVHSVAIMCNASPMEVGTVTPEELDAIYYTLFGMINGIQNAPLRRKVKYLGREYGFIEDVRDMETGAFVDIDQMSSKDTYALNLHKIMAILYRPIEAQIGDKYRLSSYVREDPEERTQRQAIFLKHMTLEEVRGASGFFLLVTQKCLSISSDSFPQLPHLTVEAVIRGAGITLFMPSQDDGSETLNTSFKRGSQKR
jgi:hypothetical protein